MEVDTEGKRLWRQIIETITVYSHYKRKVSKFDEDIAIKEIMPPYKQVSRLVKHKIIKPDINIKSDIGTKVSLSHNQLDRSTRKKLTNGSIRPEARIDLHDMTQEQAYRALVNFIHQAVAMNMRTLLVITGKGKEFKGVLRQKLPIWLESGDLSNNIISLTTAAKHDGGEGAFYIRLKNQEKKRR